MYTALLEGSAEGTHVDGAIVSVGILKKRVTITVREGFATSITGGPQASKFDALLGEVKKREAYNIAELGVGCNPNGRLIGIILEDEKVYGTVHITSGDNSIFGGNVQAGIHLDEIMLKPTMFLDEKSSSRTAHGPFRTAPNLVYCTEKMGRLESRTGFQPYNRRRGSTFDLPS